MITDDFPKLPKGYKWKVRFSTFSVHSVNVSIKRGFRTHAEGTGFPEYASGIEGAARKAAEKAYRNFVQVRGMDSIESKLKAYEAELNGELL